MKRVDWGTVERNLFRAVREISEVVKRAAQAVNYPS
jgi:hypothetical protein